MTDNGQSKRNGGENERTTKKFEGGILSWESMSTE